MICELFFLRDEVFCLLLLLLFLSGKSVNLLQFNQHEEHTEKRLFAKGNNILRGKLS